MHLGLSTLIQDALQSSSLASFHKRSFRVDLVHSNHCIKTRHSIAIKTSKCVAFPGTTCNALNHLRSPIQRCLLLVKIPKSYRKRWDLDTEGYHLLSVIQSKRNTRFIRKSCRFGQISWYRIYQYRKSSLSHLCEETPPSEHARGQKIGMSHGCPFLNKIRSQTSVLSTETRNPTVLMTPHLQFLLLSQMSVSQKKVTVSSQSKVTVHQSETQRIWSDRSMKSEHILSKRTKFNAREGRKQNNSQIVCLFQRVRVARQSSKFKKTKQMPIGKRKY